MGGIDPRTISFAEPVYLRLLVLPAALTIFWAWRLVRRRADARRVRLNRIAPRRARIAPVGELMFWLCAFAATSLCIVALARPQTRMAVIRRASADLVILQDGSASMYARDVEPDRWQRSVRFLRTFADSLSWKGDRVALALFAHRAAPQLRLTKDPNALFFFLDHLGTHSPFRLEDDPTWDTNIEEGVYWGLKLIEKDEELFGKTKNPKAFVVVSDGQAWSGNVASALASARRLGIVVHVVGVGTATGAVIPESQPPDPVAAGGVGPTAPRARDSGIRAVLDRESLRAIARAGGGEYFEIGREPDRAVASRIISSVQRRAGVSQQIENREELYWQFLLAAGVLLCAGAFFLRTSAELWWQAAGAATAVIIGAQALG